MGGKNLEDRQIQASIWPKRVLPTFTFLSTHFQNLKQPFNKLSTNLITQIIKT
jgi:hypothetical protein